MPAEWDEYQCETGMVILVYNILWESFKQVEQSGRPRVRQCEASLSLIQSCFAQDQISRNPHCGPR